MNLIHKAQAFEALHRKHDPLVLFNAWDPGSAQAVARAGARAIATGSASVAAAHGFKDGEALSLDLALANLERIVGSVELPVTLDFEGGYAVETDRLAENVRRVIAAGAVGINFEDQVVGGEGLHDAAVQCARISAIRDAADGEGVPLFINARTDLFLKAKPPQHDEAMLDAAISRSRSYSGAGASGFFAPGLREEGMIRTLCAESPLPVNILMYPDAPSRKTLADCGVARISHGPFPYIEAMKALTEAARRALDG